jgi:hypothetical protein
LFEELMTLQRLNTEKLKKIFPEKELLGLGPNFYIHVPVSHLYSHDRPAYSATEKEVE